MKSTLSLFVIGIFFTWIATIEAQEHRPPRPGGGGGGMGGGFKPSSPSSGPRPQPRPGKPPRPNTMPAKPGGPGNPGGPGGPGGIGNAGKFPNGAGAGPGMMKPKPTPYPSKPGGKPGAGNVGNFIGGHPPGTFPSYPGYRPGYTGYHKGECQQPIHNHYPYHPTYGYPFSKDWCNNFHWHYNNWPYWAAGSSAASVSTYIGVNNYTSYGYAQQVPYYPVEPAPPQVYEQSYPAPAAAVQQGQQTPVNDDAQMMNIGNFGVIPYGQKDFAYGVQLATTKDGIVRGIQWDMKANTAVEVQGSIDKTTLKIAWAATGTNALTFETNVDELTQQESMVNVYNPQTKALVSWQLIQIDQKDLPPPPQ